ncbi:MAG: Cytochrome c oxidase assembly protein subunit 15 [Friedmanniella sp.]|nr:Cytochrome c oxidase assembly protein subunit 15 [Friedmanniella sp.]
MDRLTAEVATEPTGPGARSGIGLVLDRLFGSEVALRRWAVVSLVVNILIVVTGAVVRLTGSGLGCPTWPKCSEASYVTHPALGYHGLIEFGNRLLTFVLVIVAVATWLATMLYRDARSDRRGGRRRDLRWLAGGMALGIPLQAVIGGISVLVRLNPFIVALHLLVSMVLISLAVWLVRRTRRRVAAPADRLTAYATRGVFVATWVAVVLGTTVTGSGPHAGDANVPRTGFDGALVTHLHAAAVYVTVALAVLALVRLRSRATVLVLAVLVLQAVVGIAQYRLGLPIGLVGLHLLGASLAVAAATNLMLSVEMTRPGTRTPSSAGHRPAPAARS